MNVKVNEAACIGCGACEYKESSVFQMTDEGYAKANSENVTEENKQNVIEAAEECPTGAIEINE